MPNIGDLRVWHIPQIPMNAFHVPVDSPKEAKKILDVLANYDLFQYENNVKPDYCNAAGLEVYEEGGSEDGQSPGWVDWECPETFVTIDEWDSHTD
ncbi:hypothetical protein [Achromobacter xylosoxidans]|uniref:hypothetical protein n=1 Tax=Alcaligenes xylosoxydans xylosoxydans TaxID=85698 RepID=UPI0038FCD19A